METIYLAPNFGAAIHAAFPGHAPLTMRGGASEETTIVAPAQAIFGGLFVHKRVKTAVSGSKVSLSKIGHMYGGA
jgi:hypothetical protein